MSWGQDGWVTEPNGIPEGNRTGKWMLSRLPPQSPVDSGLDCVKMEKELLEYLLI